jgi:hypothetical protein
MQSAISVQPYEASFKEYLLARLWIPAERIRLVNAEGNTEVGNLCFGTVRAENLGGLSGYLDA